MVRVVVEPLQPVAGLAGRRRERVYLVRSAHRLAKKFWTQIITGVDVPLMQTGAITVPVMRVDYLLDEDRFEHKPRQALDDSQFGQFEDFSVVCVCVGLVMSWVLSSLLWVSLLFSFLRWCPRGEEGRQDPAHATARDPARSAAGTSG